MRHFKTVALATLCLLFVLDAEAERFEVFGDFRTRLEADWDSRSGDGSQRDDRNRLRVRARLGARFRITDGLVVQVRVASGSDDKQQSTNVTILDFDDNDTGDSHFNFDRYFLNKTIGNGHVWVGKNGLPVWRQNGMFWDGDAPVAGLAFDYEIPLDDSSLSFNTGYFSLPTGMQQFAGNLALGQAVYESSFGKTRWTLAGGVLDFDADPDDEDADRLLDGNGSRDYQVWILSWQTRCEPAGRPLEVGFDLTHNAEDYDVDAADPFTAFHRDQTDGWNVQAIWGDTGEKGDWQAGLAYSRIEMFAVHNSYSSDDALRWGANNQSRVSNFKGPELRAGLGLGNDQKLVARLFLMEAIRKRADTDLALEDGNRFRIDYLVSF